MSGWVFCRDVALEPNSAPGKFQLKISANPVLIDFIRANPVPVLIDFIRANPNPREFSID
jgi:hypothetical protein